MLAIDPQKTTEKIETFIKRTMSESGYTKVVIALSGGIDSAVAATLASKALSYEKVYPVLLPYGSLNKEGVDDALRVIEKLAIPQENVTTIDITDAVNTLLKHMPGADNIRQGNVMARVRMIYLYDQAKKQQALVMGTENKTEHHLGYYTRFGDEASDIEPIRGLYKTQVFELARYLQLPEKIITKAPSAGLWSEQTDEKEFGFSYADADHILYMHFEEKLTPEEIVRRGMSAETVKKVAAWVARNSFKHGLPRVYS